MNKLIIAAGTGFLGQTLISHFKNDFDEIIILTRGKSETKAQLKYINWDGKTFSGWEKELENTTVLINLTGKSVDCRYTVQNKKEIYTSRIASTQILNQAVLQCKKPPKHWLNAATSTIYRHSIDKQMDEINGEIGDDFSMNIAKAWEESFFETKTLKTLKTALRTAIVLGENGGALVPIKLLSQIGFGGKQGNGNQFISWIHEKDFARAVAFILEKEIIGVVNLVAPKPNTNRDFMRILRKVINPPFGIPINTFLLEMGAFLIRTETELILKSRNVIPKRLLEEGFEFEFATLEPALKNLLKK